MNIMITGGAGFIASHIAEAYRDAGHTVVIIDDLSTGFKKNIPENVTFYQCDIRDEAIHQILDKHNIEIINHHAAQIDVRSSVNDPKNDLSINILGTINLLEAGIRQNIKRFIFASSGGAVYGEQDYFPADEAHPTQPCSPYGITKLTVEKYLHFYHLIHGLQYTAFRYTNVYGPRQSPHGEAGVVAIFCNKLLSGQTPIINGNGLQTRDFVFVSDVVKANLLALHMSESDILNVCTAKETNVNEIFYYITKYCSVNAEEIHGEAKPGEQFRSVCRFDKIQNRLGWTPDYSMDDGMRLTVKYFQDMSDVR